MKFKKAARQDLRLLIGIAGPSGSGKTFSALRLARGIAGDGSIYVIDTEHGRAAHYADDFDFQHGELDAPFGSARYQAAVEAAENANADVIVIDSLSHEHEGEGGLLETHEAELDRMAGQDYGRREAMKFTAWIKPKRAHKLFVNHLLRSPAHVICCFRAKDKIAMVKNAKGKTDVINVGLVPITSDRLDFEMSAMLMLPAGARGVPDMTAPACKIENHHADFFRAGAAIDEDVGAAFGAWAKGKGRGKGKAPTKTAAGGSVNVPAQDKIASDVASLGTAALRKHWKALAPATRDALADRLDAFKRIAAEADATRAPATEGGKLNV